jgi:hypothetical protein
MAWVMDNIKTLRNGWYIWCWHKHPHEPTEWFKEKYPGRAERLRLMAQDTDLPKVDFISLKPVFEKLVRKYELEYYGYNRELARAIPFGPKRSQLTSSHLFQICHH